MPHLRGSPTSGVVKNVKVEYGWRRFILDGRRGFTDYSTDVSSGGWRSGFRASRRANGLATVE
ncbi:hypothetical protein Hanom_Chr04g00365601 [Helianthus anomalus]